MDKITLSRNELYDLVWSEPLTALSKRLNVKYTELRRICNEMKVPLPPHGHWSKLKFGNPLTVLELPTDYDGANEVQITPIESQGNNPDVLKITKKSVADEIKADPKLTLTIPRSLTNPDKLVIAAQKQLLEYKYNRHNDHGMVRSEGAFPIRVSRSNVGRALRFLDTLIKLLKARGHNLDVITSKSIHIDDEQFNFKLMEKTKKGTPEPKWGFARFESTGLLYFEIKGIMDRTWIDGNILIEKRLDSIIAKIESILSFWKEHHRINEEERLKREEQERIIHEQQQRIEKERSEFKDLYQQAKRWQRARFMREYINAFEQNAVEKGRLTNEIQLWIKWARDKVDWYDPLVGKVDDWLTLKGLNRNS